MMLKCIHDYIILSHTEYIQSTYRVYTELYLSLLCKGVGGVILPKKEDDEATMITPINFKASSDDIGKIDYIALQMFGRVYRNRSNVIRMAVNRLYEVQKRTTLEDGKEVRD